MSNKENKGLKRIRRPGGGKAERYVQPSILLGLNLKPAYGYELIHSIQEFGFVEGQAPPGMIYRHLRQLEEDGLVQSQWETEGTGPARRMYRLTPEGGEVLAIWIGYMERQAATLQNFIGRYRRLKSPA
ncbi:MAG: helix-turn-helix transcriptional regulator [Desulfobacterales bacterium]